MRMTSKRDRLSNAWFFLTLIIALIPFVFMVLRRKSRLAGFSLVFAWLGICSFSRYERVSYAIEEHSCVVDSVYRRVCLGRNGTASLSARGLETLLVETGHRTRLGPREVPMIQKTR